MSEDDGSVENDDSVENDGTGTDVADDHVEDAPDGCGCVEIWEHLARQREDRE